MINYPEIKINDEIYQKYLSKSIKYNQELFSAITKLSTELNTTELNTTELKSTELKSTELYVYLSNTEIKLLEQKFNFQIINILRKKNSYDFALERLNDLKKIFYNNPSKFHLNEIAIKYFNKEKLKSFENDVEKLINNNVIKPNKSYKVHDEKLSQLYNNYIYNDYINFLNELLKNEQNN
jgi:hypothetical protein